MLYGMMRNLRPWRSGAVILAMLFILTIGTGNQVEAQYSPTADCPAQLSWVTDPHPPQEIPGDGETFCQFYQFAWQWFLYLGSPSDSDPGIRNFQNQKTFPVLASTPSNSCGDGDKGSGIFVRLKKSADPTSGFVIPEEIHQAGKGQATIYDQQGKVVFFTTSFSRDMCTTSLAGDLPAGTTELKMAWRQIEKIEADRYFTMETTIKDEEGKDVLKGRVLLGLIGIHVVRTTALHPEAMWATFEHIDNAPDCLWPAPVTHNWSFTSPEAAECLMDSSPSECQDQFEFNVAKSHTGLTGKSTEVCRVYRNGTKPWDKNTRQNDMDVDNLNRHLMGPNGFVTTLPATDPMAVWKNYHLVGGIWVSDPKLASNVPDSTNQRGSLELTNTVAETTEQGWFNDDGTRTNARNCFGCHPYTPKVTAVIPKDDEEKGTWSHILGQIRK